MIPNIENAFENIKAVCESRLKELYPLGIPELINERYELELSFLKNSNHIEDFEIMRIIFAEAEKSSYPIYIRGSNSSYIQYLITKSDLNPLPTHYYCKKCGHFETVPTRLFGIDLSDDICPLCNSDLIGDGCNLTHEWTWGIDGNKTIGFEYDIPKEFLPFAKRALMEAFSEHEIVPYGIFYRDDRGSKTKVLHGGYFILPVGQTINDYPDMIAYLENGEKCLTRTFYDIRATGLHDILMLPNDTIEKLLLLQRKTGYYANEISLAHIHSITWNDIVNTNCLTNAATALFQNSKPKSFYNMTCLFSASNASYSDDTYSPVDEKYNMIPKLHQTDEFIKYPCYTKDDFFETLLNLGYQKSQAFQIATAIWRGQANSKKEQHINFFNSLNLPNDFMKIAKAYLYLWDRASCARFILIFAKLAYYSKIDSRLFGQTVHR